MSLPFGGGGACKKEGRRAGIYFTAEEQWVRNDLPPPFILGHKKQKNVK